MSNDRKPNIFLAVPAYGGSVRNACAESLIRLSAGLVAAGIQIGGRIINRENIAHVRNYYGSLMIEQSAFTHLLFADYDMVFRQDTVVKLIEAAKPIIGAVYARRTDPVEPSYYGKPALAAALDQVPGTGMGLTLIETHVFRELAATGNLQRDNPPHPFECEGLKGPLFGFFDRIRRRGARDVEEYSEDYSFCIRWRELCGGEVWVLGGEDVGHIGEKVYRLGR